jgi:transcriptional regulator with XRE-family HTH domain
MFGNKIRKLREEKGLVLRQLAAALEIDTATMSKIERGDRQARKDHLPILSEILETNYQELHTLWLAHKVYELVADEEDAIAALTVAEEQVAYQKTIKKAKA